MKTLKFHYSLIQILITTVTVALFSAAESSAVWWGRSREAIHTTKTPAGTEMSDTDCTVQGTRDFLSSVYPLSLLLALSMFR